MKKVFFKHFRADNKFSRNVTVAGVVENGVLNLAAAICHENDNFEKAIGREVAQSRLNNPHFKTSDINEMLESEIMGNSTGKIFNVLAESLARKVSQTLFHKSNIKKEKGLAA